MLLLKLEKEIKDFLKSVFVVYISWLKKWAVKKNFEDVVNHIHDLQINQLTNSFFFFFLTAIWLSHDQLWAILEGTASLTQC